MYFFNSSYTSFFSFIGACFFNQRSCLRYFYFNFSPANLTAYVANVNPALTSHVLNNIKICFLKVRRADADFTPMSPMRRRYSVRSLHKSNTLPCKLR